MSKFAPVVPLELASMMSFDGELGDYHLLLAHDVLAHPKEYAEIYGDKNYTIIMDNSLIELGYPMMMDEVMEAAFVVGAQFFVLPDHLNDHHRTMEMTRDALEEYRRNIMKYRDAATSKGVAIPSPMPVVQGKNYEEANMAIDLFFRDFDCICIPRIAADTLGTRSRLIARAAALDMKVHLLGFSENFLDDIACARMPSVMGIDSAVPVRAGLKGMNMSLDFPKDPGKRGNYWEDPFQGLGSHMKEKCYAMATYNCTKIRQWIKP